MSKQCYWSSGARRKDWSVNSLRCWRCLVINTPDETPSKAHPSLAGSLLLFALLLSLHQASSPVFSVVGSWCLIVLSAPGLNLLLFLALLIIVLLLFVLLSIYCFLSSSLCHSFLPLSVCHQCNSNPIYFQLFSLSVSASTPYRSSHYVSLSPFLELSPWAGNLQAVIIKNLRKGKWSWFGLVCITYIDSLVNHMKIRQLQTHLIQFAEAHGSAVIFRVSYCSVDRR